MRRLRAPVLALWLALCAGPALAAAPRPHIVIFLADDLGWKDVGFHGSEIATPNLDRLAAEGARLETLYAQPVCSPTRAALLTGRYPMRYGLQVGVIAPDARYGLPLAERTLAQALRDAGYATSMLGKWHLGSFDPRYGPTRRGFEHHYGNLLGNLDHWTHRRDGRLDWYRDGVPVDEKGYTTQLLAAEALRILRAHDPARPLFLYVAFDATHAPLQAPPAYVQRYAGIASPDRRAKAAMTTCMDDAIGAIVAELARRGMRENTLILFASDNGGPRGPGGGSDNDPWRGGKGSDYEGGVRVAALAAWTGHIPAGSRVDAMLHVVDWYPTLLRLAGASLDQPLPLDGRDAWPAIAQAGPAPRDEVLIDVAPTGGALRRGDWKLVARGALPERVPGSARLELYDLARDPAEREDVSQRERARARDLLARLDALAREAAPPLAAP